jgi:osmotically-inducible protein OsmY
MCAKKHFSRRTYMVAVKTSQPDLAEFFRCNEQPGRARNMQNEQAGQKSTDIIIAEKVDSALWKNGMLRGTDYREIDVIVKDGIVFLSGHVISTGNQIRAVDAARTIQGVVGVKDYLVLDNKITLDVAGALGKIEQAHGVKFFTGTQNGVVLLNGEVSNISVRSLAEKCAASVPGVRGVINSIRVPGFDLKSEDQRFLQPSIGKSILFLDGLSGVVQKVIINPDNLRVIALVLSGRFSSSQQDPRLLMYGEEQVPERLITIPMRAVRGLTRSSGYLHIKSTEGAEYADFNSSGFTAPRADWTAPYPYCAEDILFPLESGEDTISMDLSTAVVDPKIPSNETHAIARGPKIIRSLQ